jgi:hypothetical protein
MFSDGMHFLFFPWVPCHSPSILSSLIVSSCNYASIKQERTCGSTFCLHYPSLLPSVASECSASHSEDTRLKYWPEYRSLWLRSWNSSVDPGTGWDNTLTQATFTSFHSRSSSRSGQERLQPDQNEALCTCTYWRRSGMANIVQFSAEVLFTTEFHVLNYCVEWVGRDWYVCIVYISRPSGACNTLVAFFFFFWKTYSIFRFTSLFIISVLNVQSGKDKT